MITSWPRGSGGPTSTRTPGTPLARSAASAAARLAVRLASVSARTPSPGKREGDRPAGAAGADQQHLAALEGDVARPRALDQADAIEHVADRAPVRLEAHRVDRADQPAVGAELIAEPGHRLLVRDGQQQAAQVAELLQPRHHLGQILGQDVQGNEGGIQAMGVERRVEELGRPDMRDRMREDRVEMRLARQLHRHFSIRHKLMPGAQSSASGSKV